MQHSSGAGSTSDTAATGSATPGSVTPGTLPSTTPTQRATTGVMENQQALDRPQDQPSTIQPNPVTTNPSDTRTEETVTNSQRGSGGTATGRPSTVRIIHPIDALRLSVPVTSRTPPDWNVGLKDALMLAAWHALIALPATIECRGWG